MTIISILILVFFVLSSILLITIVLIQDDQGGGIGGMFGGGGSAAFGARTGNVLTRITTVLAIIFFISAFALKSFTGWHGSLLSGNDPCDLVVQPVYFT